jgi:hypothetical protein
MKQDKGFAFENDSGKAPGKEESVLLQTLLNAIKRKKRKRTKLKKRAPELVTQGPSEQGELVLLQRALISVVLIYLIYRIVLMMQ